MLCSDIDMVNLNKSFLAKGVSGFSYLGNLYRITNLRRFGGVMDEYFLATPLGPLHIVCSDKGVTKIKFSKGDASRSESEHSVLKNQHVKEAVEWLRVYFDDLKKLQTLAVPQLDLEAHENKKFVTKVWQVLKKQVAPGTTVSYGNLAKLCDNPNGARAVGMAMRTNPFTILVPCHRVIDANGKLGNYSSGVDKKVWLLKHEGNDF